VASSGVIVCAGTVMVATIPMTTATAVTPNIHFIRVILSVKYTECPKKSSILQAFIDGKVGKEHFLGCRKPTWNIKCLANNREGGKKDVRREYEHDATTNKDVLGYSHSRGDGGLFDSAFPQNH
jgi:hypothetical protein